MLILQAKSFYAIHINLYWTETNSAVYTNFHFIPTYDRKKYEMKWIISQNGQTINPKM